MEHVLLITVRSDIGGGSKHVADLLNAKSLKFSVAAPDGQYFSSVYKEKSCSFLSIPFRKFSLITLYKLYFFIRNNDVKLVHSHGFGAGIYSFFLSIFGIQFVHTFHGIETDKSFYNFAKRIINKCIGLLSKKCICVSQFERSIALNFLNISPSSLEVIYNSTELSQFEYQGLKTNPKEVVIGSISRLDKVKDIPRMIEYCNRYFEKNENIKLLIAGEGDESKSLRELATKSSLPVEFLGFVKPEDFYMKVNVVVSFSKSEGMPLGVLEAMSANLPLVVSDIEAHKELNIENNLKTFNTYEQFEHALDQILSNKFSGHKRGREIIKKYFSPSWMINETIRTYS